MNRAPAFQFYPDDWLSSPKISTMTPAEEGAYIRLLSYSWNDPDCTIPDDDTSLAMLSRLGEGWLNGSGNKLRACFVPHPKKTGRLFNVRLMKERKKQEDWRKKSQQGGKRSAESRASRANERSRVVEGCFKGGSTLVEPKGNSSSSSSFSSSLKKEREKKSGVTSSTPVGPPQGNDELNILSPQEIQSMWNSIPGVKTCRDLGKVIRTRLQSRIKEHPERAWWEGLFVQVRASNFLCGRTNNSRDPFQASLSWALGPENLEKILAGNYDNPQQIIGQSLLGCEFRMLNGSRHKACGDPVVLGSKYCVQHHPSKSVLPANEVAL